MDTKRLHEVLRKSPMSLQVAIWRGYSYLLYTKKGYVSRNVLNSLCHPTSATGQIDLPEMEAHHLFRALYHLPKAEQFAIVEGYCNPNTEVNPTKWEDVDRVYYAACSCGQAMITKINDEEVAWYTTHTKQKGHAGVTGTATTIPSPIFTHWHWV